MCEDRSAAHFKIRRIIRKNKQNYIGHARVLVFGLASQK
jgi:hypothetical protein